MSEDPVARDETPVQRETVVVDTGSRGGGGAIIAILVLHSYQEWGPVGRALLGCRIIGGVPWVDWFAPTAKWVAVALTFVSGWIYLWKNRAIYLQDL